MDGHALETQDRSCDQRRPRGWKESVRTRFAALGADFSKSASKKSEARQLSCGGEHQGASPTEVRETNCPQPHDCALDHIGVAPVGDLRRVRSSELICEPCELDCNRSVGGPCDRCNCVVFQTTRLIGAVLRLEDPARILRQREQLPKDAA